MVVFSKTPSGIVPSDVKFACNGPSSLPPKIIGVSDALTRPRKASHDPMTVWSAKRTEVLAFQREGFQLVDSALVTGNGKVRESAATE